MQEYYVIEFNGVDRHPNYSSYAYQSANELCDGASVLNCKTWKTAAGAEKALLKMQHESSYLLKKYNDVRVVTIDDSDIESEKAAKELRKFTDDLDYLRRKAENYERTLKSKMELRRAKALIALASGDVISYYPNGYLGERKLQKVEAVSISTLQFSGKAFNRVSGKCLEDHSCVLPDLGHFHEYFEPYQRIQEFIKTNWDDVPVDVLAKFSDALIKGEYESSYLVQN